MDLFIEFFIEQWVLFLALIASFVMLFVHESRKAGPAATPQQAITLVNSAEGVFLDIRDGSDYKKGHIADSVHIPLSQLPTRRDELWCARWASLPDQPPGSSGKPGLCERKK